MTLIVRSFTLGPRMVVVHKAENVRSSLVDLPNRLLHYCANASIYSQIQSFIYND